MEINGNLLFQFMCKSRYHKLITNNKAKQVKDQFQMTWHETIDYIRQQPEYADLVRLAYFDKDLILNIVRFGKSEEFQETLKLINKYVPEAKKILDIGAGNGISSINFALKGYEVTVLEPDPSDTVGANAIRTLQAEYKLDNLSVYERYAESTGLPANSFDIIYVRQAMHHAHDLKQFIAECARLLKPGGVLLTMRDHVVFNKKDKERFLETHPLHKFYGGENAFTSSEYKGAMLSAGLHVLEEMKYFDSVINHFPMSTLDMSTMKAAEEKLRQELKSKIGPLANIKLFFRIYKYLKGFKNTWGDESKIPGRMYSFVSGKLVKSVFLGVAYKTFDILKHAAHYE